MRLIFLVIVALLVVASCSEPDTAKSALSASGDAAASGLKNNRSNTVDKVEVFHFHKTSQCYSCKTVGAYAEETVNTYFPDEVKSGKVIFGHSNVELAQNMELVTRYNVTGAGLWIGVYDQDGFHKEENVNVWYKINNKDDYMFYLKGIIEVKLSGN